MVEPHTDPRAGEIVSLEDETIAAGVRMAADYAASVGLVALVELSRLNALADFFERGGECWEVFYAEEVRSRRLEKEKEDKRI